MRLVQSVLIQSRLIQSRLIQAALLLCLLAVAGGAVASRKTDKLDANQYAWSGAIRWGDFEGAWNLVDPKIREAQPVSDLEFERYKQVQITSYRDRGSNLDKKAGTAVRDVEIGVVNRHTLAERSVRYREQWRWDEEGKTWWLTTGLPDLWDGL
ncbi:hypothetical protein ACFOLC_12825 [Lysobacter cavernae]|uniref:Uncharacterized protein n=1 Tax=Lysobacter cavernae TaxID=1685901 RepID=A0ABV7RQF7_9GAMM